MATTRFSWFVVQSRPHAQRQAQRHLEQQGFTTFLPEVIEPAKNGAKLKPMFGAYFFVSFSLRERVWRYIPSTIGVYRLLSADAETPLALPDGFVAALQTQLGENGRMDLREQANDPVGSRVRITSGPLAGLEGICSASQRARISVLLTLLGGQREVSLSTGDVEVVG